MFLRCVLLGVATSCVLLWGTVRGVTFGGESVLYGVAGVAVNNVSGTGSNGSRCAIELGDLYDGVEMKRLWAMKALDASGQPNSGFLQGNNFWTGFHSHCSEISNRKPLEINHAKIPHPSSTPHDFPPFDMRFVTVLLRHNSTLQKHTQMPLEYTIQLGLCVPSSCDSNELSGYIQDFLDGRNLFVQELYNMDIKVEKIRPLREDFLWIFLQPSSLALLSIVGLICLMTISGTILEIKEGRQLHNMIQGFNKIQREASKNVSELGLVTTSTDTLDHNQPNTFTEILKCFSLKTNLNSLMKTKLASENVSSIHGLRFFGMLWVILVHAVFYQGDFLKDVPYAYRLSETFFNQILSNSTYCVDTYLFLSGFLVAYLFYKTKSQTEERKPINHTLKILEYLRMFVNRFLRLTPTYLIILGFANMIFTYYRQTAMLYPSEQLEENCANYWWRNLLYINNLFPRNEMCLSWSWYLSLDTQCFAVSTFLLILSTIYFKTAIALLFSIILGCIAATGYKSYSIGYIPTMDEQLVRLDDIYDLPWNRMGPYLVGVITGYILMVKMQQKLVLKKSTLALLWTIFPMINLWILFTLYTRNLSVTFSAVYMAVSRTLWGIGLGWLLIACCTNNAGLINKFLSYPGWIPLSRMTYCAYLLNPLVANMMYLGSENVFAVSSMSFTMSVSAVCFGTFVYSFFASLFFETPFIRLNKLLVGKLGKKESVESSS